MIHNSATLFLLHNYRKTIEPYSTKEAKEIQSWAIWTRWLDDVGVGETPHMHAAGNPEAAVQPSHGSPDRPESGGRPIHFWVHACTPTHPDTYTQLLTLTPPSLHKRHYCVLENPIPGLSGKRTCSGRDPNKCRSPPTTRQSWQKKGC